MRRSPERLLGLVVALGLVLALPAGALPLPRAVPGAADATTDEASSLLVGFAPGADLAAALGGLGSVTTVLSPLDVAVVTVPAGTAEAVRPSVAALPGVRFAEANARVGLADVPNDPSYDAQYALPIVNASFGWALYGRDFATTGGARLAVVDSGIDRLHPEFAGKVVDCQSWVTGLGLRVPVCQEDNVHGTHVSGIAAAATNNGRGIAGIAHDAEIMALQAFNPTGTALTADIVAAIVYAAENGAQVANYSFGAAAESQAQREAVGLAAARGVTQVAASGNDGDEDSVNFPARFPEVIAVGSTDAEDQVSTFSSRGPEVEVSAPGTAILSTLPGGLYGNLSGTSMASPHVAGLAALLRAEGLSPEAARAAIVEGANDLGPPGRDDGYGAGRINVANSLLLAQP